MIVFILWYVFVNLSWFESNLIGGDMILGGIVKVEGLCPLTSSLPLCLVCM